jgi:hypothetical protein
LKLQLSNDLSLCFELRERKIIADSVFLDELLRLMKPRTESLAQVVVGNSDLTIKLYQVRDLGLAVKVRSLGVEALLDILRYFEADGHGPFPLAKYKAERTKISAASLEIT